VIAHGFRNAYDFDFNQLGDLFTYDSDVEREFLLPWYVPTRLYQVQFAATHGWRLPGFQRSYAQSEHYPWVVPRLQSLGRGSPTGVAVYRHFQFPPIYQNGLFSLDWTFAGSCLLRWSPKDRAIRLNRPCFSTRWERRDLPRRTWLWLRMVRCWYRSEGGRPAVASIASAIRIRIVS
jgi:hypothetical protein